MKLSKALKEMQNYSSIIVSDILKKWQKKLKDMGIKPNTWLGSGTMGIAYTIPDPRKVLKITMDDREANSAHRLIGKNLKHVYAIYNVFQFDKTGYFGIVQERLIPIVLGEHSSFFNVVIQDRSFDSLMFNAANEIEAKEDINELIKILASDDVTVKESNVKFVSNIFEQAADGVYELRKNGIDWKDLHEGNIMQRPNGDIVIIDIGWSISQPAEIEEI